MEIVVFGAGSLGSLLGGLLAREHDVTLVGRNPHVRAIDERGLRISGAIETTVRPAARLDVPEAADLAIVCVKSFDTPDAAAARVDCDLDACLSVQNGMGNEPILADRLDAPVLAGTCSYGALRPSPGEIRCTGVGDVVLGARTGGSSALADRAGRAFERAGIVASVDDDMPARLWEKLAVNAGINATTALARIDNGSVLGSDAWSVASSAARETAEVARFEGIDLPNSTAERAVRTVAEATADNTSSMQQDVLADRRTEIDSINGFVVDRADEHGIDAPVNRTLARLIRTWEAGRGVR